MGVVIVYARLQLFPLGVEGLNVLADIFAARIVHCRTRIIMPKGNILNEQREPKDGSNKSPDRAMTWRHQGRPRRFGLGWSRVVELVE